MASGQPSKFKASVEHLQAAEDARHVADAVKRQHEYIVAMCNQDNSAANAAFAAQEHAAIGAPLAVHAASRLKSHSHTNVRPRVFQARGPISSDLFDQPSDVDRPSLVHFVNALEPPAPRTPMEKVSLPLKHRKAVDETFPSETHVQPVMRQKLDLNSGLTYREWSKRAVARREEASAAAARVNTRWNMDMRAHHSSTGGTTVKHRAPPLPRTTSQAYSARQRALQADVEAATQAGGNASRPRNIPPVPPSIAPMLPPGTIYGIREVKDVQTLQAQAALKKHAHDIKKLPFWS